MHLYIIPHIVKWWRSSSEYFHVFFEPPSVFLSFCYLIREPLMQRDQWRSWFPLTPQPSVFVATRLKKRKPSATCRLESISPHWQQTTARMDCNAISWLSCIRDGFFTQKPLQWWKKNNFGSHSDQASCINSLLLILICVCVKSPNPMWPRRRTRTFISVREWTRVAWQKCGQTVTWHVCLPSQSSLSSTSPPRPWTCSLMELSLSLCSFPVSSVHLFFFFVLFSVPLPPLHVPGTPRCIRHSPSPTQRSQKDLPPSTPGARKAGATARLTLSSSCPTAA